MTPPAWERVGPVLESGEVALAIVDVIRQENEDVTVEDRGAYLRVSAPWRCRLSRTAVEKKLGRAFRLPGDLEQVMPSFKGRLSMSSDAVVWEVPSA
jgi:toluene monooxygenase system protein D